MKTTAAYILSVLLILAAILAVDFAANVWWHRFIYNHFIKK